MALETLPVRLDLIIDEISTSHGKVAQEKGIAFKVEASPDIPKMIVTDPLRLKQVLNNIVGNATKFTTRGSVTLGIELEKAGAQSELLRFTVSDTGRGISEEEAQKLFEPFTQADPSTTRKFGGTGLGLSLSRRLARMLGGDVVLQRSEPGLGSSFIITIETGRRGSDEFLLLAEKGDSLSGNSEPALRDMCILVVDDSRDNQALMSRILRLEGAAVDVAENGQVGVEKAIEGHYDVVLMDVQMPVMDGYQALQSLRAQNYKRPIIALTAHAMREEKMRCLALGFDSHLSKPIDRQALRRQLLSYKKDHGAPVLEQH